MWSWSEIDQSLQELSFGATKKFLVMLGLHYVPGGHGNHVSGHRGQNGMDVRQRGGTGWAT